MLQERRIDWYDRRGYSRRDENIEEKIGEDEGGVIRVKRPRRAEGVGKRPVAQKPQYVREECRRREYDTAGWNDAREPYGHATCFIYRATRRGGLGRNATCGRDRRNA